MNTYRLTDYDSSVWLQHERVMTEEEFRALLLQHLEPLAAAERELREEGLAKFGGGAVFCYVEDGKVIRWCGGEVEGVDPVAFEEWQSRFQAATIGVISKVAAAAGFVELRPVASLSCSDSGPLEMLEGLTR